LRKAWGGWKQEETPEQGLRLETGAGNRTGTAKSVNQAVGQKNLSKVESARLADT